MQRRLYALGSVAATTSASQQQTTDVRYTAYGTEQSYNGSLNTFGWNGKSQYQKDRESGLMLLGHRYYDVSTGRFLSEDPAGDGSNWYAYCENNPLTAVDPSGQTAVGHHYVPQAVYKGAGIEGEALQVFENAVTGQTEPNHDFRNGHYDYNKAVKEKLGDYMKSNNIDPKHMSSQQAKDFVKIVKKSKDPRISNYLSYVHKARRAYMAKAAREGMEKGLKRLRGPAARRIPVVAIGFFAYDWYSGGLKHAINEAAWPIPVFKEKD